jgi:hypothetical protein
MNSQAFDSAYALLRDSVMRYRGEPVGTVAALAGQEAAANYQDCFVRDFVPSALVFLADGEHVIVRNFLRTLLDLRVQHERIQGHGLEPAVLPASFRVICNGEDEEIRADFGDHAIGRVAPVDAMMWWVILLALYTRTSQDRSLIEDQAVQHALCSILELTLREGFEVFPTLLVPDGSFMIDRRMGVYGHPLEIQTLFHGMLVAAVELLHLVGIGDGLIEIAEKRANMLRTYLQVFYWLDLERLNEIHRYKTEEFGDASVNMLNIYPESIPDWVVNWITDRGGYLVGNLGPGRMDFRFFALGNLLAILFGITSERESHSLMSLYHDRWDDLVGRMPAKLVFPAVVGKEWMFMTGSDPKNVPWSYHNGGNWPVLLWPLVAAALKTGRGDLAQLALDVADQSLPKASWPEYYDGQRGNLIGRRAQLNQVWSATSYLLAHKLIDDPGLLDLCDPTQPITGRLPDSRRS